MPDDPERPGADDPEVSLSGDERTLTDRDQTLTDVAPSGVAEEQTNAVLASSGDRGVHQFSRDIRQRGSRGSEQTARTRLAVAARRDEMWTVRDRAAARRDETAEAWDRTMAGLDAAFEACFGSVPITASEIVMRFGEYRKCARKYREQAAAHRAFTAADRRAAAEDRLRAAHDRLLAAEDREALARQLVNISVAS